MFLDEISDAERQCLITGAGGSNELMVILEEEGLGADLVGNCVKIDTSINATLQIFGGMSHELFNGGEAEKSTLIACLNNAFEPMRNESRVINDPAIEAEVDAMNDEYNACLS